MKTEDFLWDKTGSDPEIERLENALTVFRYKECAPPEIGAKVLPFAKKEPARSFARLAFAAAACVAFAVLALGLWLNVSGRKHEVAQTQVAAPADIPAAKIPAEGIDVPAESAAPTIEKRILEAAPIKEAKNREVETAARSGKSKSLKIKKPVYQARATARETKKPADGLTKEEKYAYEQLMLALSITGSKLKLVSDKIDGKTVAEDGR